jgi:hypothetical protein
MQDITKNTLPPNPPKKGVGSGNNRPKKIKEVTKISVTISVDPIIWANAKKAIGRGLSSRIEDFLKILAKE